MNDTQEPTAEQKKEWTIEALNILGFNEQEQYPGMYSREMDNIRSVVDLTAGTSYYLYDIVKSCRIDGDDKLGTLSKLERVIKDAEGGAMPAKTEPDIVVSGGQQMPANKPRIKPVQGQLIPQQAGGVPIDLTVETIIKYINPKATEQEAYVFMQLCQARGLNPFTGDAYLVKYDHVSAATMIVGKSAFLKRAQAHPQYNGFEAGIIVKDEIGTIERRTGSFILPTEELLGGWAKAHRKDVEHPAEAEVTFEEYVGKKGNGEINKMWSSKPATMIRKVPLVQVLREAFAAELSGMYVREEIDMGEVVR